MQKKDLLIVSLLVVGVLGIIFASTYVLYHPHTVPVDEFIAMPVLTMGTH